MTSELDQNYWDERWEQVYRTRQATADSREPNPQLRAEVSALKPGRALDAGCGNGSDAMWLATQGWQVTAADFSTAALKHARRRADDANLGDRIDWVHADLGSWTPPAARFDLVTSHYLHGVPQRTSAFRRLGNAVAPGGTLLIVGHHPDDRPDDPAAPPLEAFFRVEELLDALDPAGWHVVVAETRVRPGADHDGNPITRTDAVLRAQRR
ncbi:class I SAM-dependent methyltransferase [Mycolicibacterium sp. XJ879]